MHTSNFCAGVAVVFFRARRPVLLFGFSRFLWPVAFLFLFFPACFFQFSTRSLSTVFFLRFRSGFFFRFGEHLLRRFFSGSGRKDSFHPEASGAPPNAARTFGLL